jgi:hypothetical protein
MEIELDALGSKAGMMWRTASPGVALELALDDLAAGVDRLTLPALDLPDDEGEAV